MLFTFAFRNVLRNRRRSFLTALAIFFAAMIVGLAQGWVNGMLEVYIQNYITYQTGNIRVTTRGYVERERFMPVDEIIARPGPLLEKIRNLPGVSSVEERVRFGLLLGHGDMTENALGVGLDLRHSRFELQRKLVAGRMGDAGIYIGKVLADRLKVKPGDSLLLATKTSEGGLNGIKLPVAGIVSLGITMFDKRVFFISLADAKRLLKITDGTTEIYVFSAKTHETDPVLAALKPLLPSGVSARTYREQMGNLYETFAVMKVIYIFIEALILFLASFVVINTMMMAVFERLHEIGTLKAIGMSDRELFLNFTLEGALIGAGGGIPGALLGYLVIMIFSYTGINMQAALASLEMPLEYIIRPTLSLLALTIAVVLSIVVPALAAMIPARYAGALTAAEALRK